MRNVFIIFLIAMIAVIGAGCVSNGGFVLKADIPVEAIPSAQIEKALPKEWCIESISPANTVSGWKKLSGFKGLCITISRTPYDNTLRRKKSGELAVSSPQFLLFVFPSDFKGKNVNSSSVFSKGEVTKSESALVACRGMLVLNDFNKVGNWYVFHNSPSFKDWKNPADDIIKMLTEAPTKSD